MPPSCTWPNSSSFWEAVTFSLVFSSVAPSATTTMENFLPCLRRFLGGRVTSSEFMGETWTQGTAGAPGAAEDGAADVQDAGDALAGEGLGGVLDQALPAVEDAHALQLVRLGATHHRADHRVEPGAVAAAGEDSDLHSRAPGRSGANLGKGVR